MERRRRRGSISSARATRRSNRIAEEVGDEPESQQLGASFADLPSHIAAHILLRLPLKSILICKCVCRSWKALISDPHFAKSHFPHSPLGFMIRAAEDRKLSRIMYLLDCELQKFLNDVDGQFCCCEDSYIKPGCNRHFKLDHKLKLPFHGAKLALDKRDETKKRGRPWDRQSHHFHFNYKFDVVSSCNGLLCLCGRGGDYFVVCNPITGEFIRLPKASRFGKTNEISIPETFAGFGFQPKTNQYKVLRILKRHGLQGHQTFMFVEIHTLGTSTWRNVGVDPMLCYLYSFEGATCVGGALHWIGFNPENLSILCFDFESERFQSFPSPPHLCNYGNQNITMGELRGTLYICDSSSPFILSMWIMKEYGFGESWTMVFSIDTTPTRSDCWPYGGSYFPVNHFKDGGAILMYHSSDCFIYYEPEKHRVKTFKVRGTRSTSEVILHIPSLISLKDAVKGDNIEVLNVHPRCEELTLLEENEVLFLAKVNKLNKVGAFEFPIIISSDDE